MNELIIAERLTVKFSSFFKVQFPFESNVFLDFCLIAESLVFINNGHFPNLIFGHKNCLFSIAFIPRLDFNLLLQANSRKYLFFKFIYHIMKNCKVRIYVQYCATLVRYFGTLVASNDLYPLLRFPLRIF